MPSNVSRTSAASGVNGTRRDVSQESRIEMPTFGEREREAEIFATNLNYNQPNPTLEERERAAGLTDTTTGREEFQQEQQQGQEVAESEEELDTDMDDQFGTIGVILCINGEPFGASILGQIGPKLES